MKIHAICSHRPSKTVEIIFIWGAGPGLDWLASKLFIRGGEVGGTLAKSSQQALTIFTYARTYIEKTRTEATPPSTLEVDQGKTSVEEPRIVGRLGSILDRGGGQERERGVCWAKGITGFKKIALHCALKRGRISFVGNILSLVLSSICYVIYSLQA